MASQASTPTMGDSKHLIKTSSISLWTRLIYILKIRLIQNVLLPILLGISALPGIRKVSDLPTFEKAYPIQKTLTTRVFIPKSYKSGDPLLPLYIDIHGGGFCLGKAEIDDFFCAQFAHEKKILVVSLNYPKAPGSPFPGAVRALTDIVKAVLEDEALPFDKKKVAIGGFSAGANLALAVCQDVTLRGRIGGAVPFYGCLDFITTTRDKLATRPANSGQDPLKNMAPMFNWAYINSGTDLRDPQLSVALAPQENLPPKISFFGCELDLLCREAEVMAERIASERSGEIVQSSNLWEKEGVRWEKILGEEHGFEAMPSYGAKKVRVEKRGKEMFASAADFLFREVYA